MSLRVVKEVVKAILNMMEVLRVLKTLSPPSITNTGGECEVCGRDV